MIVFLRCANRDAPIELVIARGPQQDILELSPETVIKLVADGAKFLWLKHFPRSINSEVAGLSSRKRRGGTDTRDQLPSSPNGDGT